MIRHNGFLQQYLEFLAKPTVQFIPLSSASNKWILYMKALMYSRQPSWSPASSLEESFPGTGSVLLSVDRLSRLFLMFHTRVLHTWLAMMNSFSASPHIVLAVTSQALPLSSLTSACFQDYSISITLHWFQGVLGAGPGRAPTNLLHAPFMRPGWQIRVNLLKQDRMKRPEKQVCTAI